MGGIGIVGLKYGFAVDEYLAHSGLQNGGEGLSAGDLARDAYGARLLGFLACALFLQRKPVTALGLAAGAELELVTCEQLLGGEQQAFGVACFQLQFRLADLPGLIARADLAVIDGRLDLASLRLDRARRALHNRLKDRPQGCSLRGLLDRPLDLFVGDLREIGRLAIDRGLP